MSRTQRLGASLAAALLPALALAQGSSEIRVGGIFDLTGITADVGKPYAQGVRDGVQDLPVLAEKVHCTDCKQCGDNEHGALHLVRNVTFPAFFLNCTGTGIAGQMVTR